MAGSTRARLTEVRVRTATAGDTKHRRQLFDGLGSDGLYQHVTPAEAKCRVQQLTAPDAATGKWSCPALVDLFGLYRSGSSHAPGLYSQARARCIPH